MARRATATEGETKDVMKDIKVRLTLMEPMLGTAPNDPEIYSRFIASKAPDAVSREQEIATIGADEYEEKQITIFRRDNEGNPIIMDYLIKGFFKNACSALREVNSTKSSKLTSYKKKIDGLVFIMDRMIPIQFPEGTEMSICQRPLRAQTAQGERVALASSEQVPAGSVLEFTIRCFNSTMAALVVEWLDYGQYNGLGQWHNSGMGRFTWEDITDK